MHAVVSGQLDAQAGADTLSVLADTQILLPMSGGQKSWQLAALFSVGAADLALADMRRYWGFQLAQGATTAWEQLDLNTSPPTLWQESLTSRCHGWSAGPSWLLPRYVLGVAPSAPGFAHIRLRPQLGDLDWAAGEVPTPHGNIRIELARGGGRVVLPYGVTAQVAGRQLGSGEHRLSPGDMS